MEFDELKKIWDTQNNELMYAINETALHARIQSKMKQASHISNFSELMLIFVNAIAGTFVLAMDVFNGKGNVYMYLLAGWMLLTSLYTLVGRINRIKGTHQFDRSMTGDLDHALSIATYQVRLSQIMRWNIVPIVVFTVLGIWDGGKSIWVVMGTVLFFALAFYASKWEHHYYKRKKQELEVLKSKL